MRGLSWPVRARNQAAPPGEEPLARPLQLYARAKAQEAYWAVSRTTGRLEGDRTSDMLAGDILSFSEEDDRDTEAGPKDSAKVLSRRIMADLGSDVVYINESKPEGWFYATPVGRVTAAPAGARIYSGRHVLRTMLRAAQVAQEEPFVVGVAFGGTPTTAVLMFVCDDRGKLSKMQYVPAAGDDLSATVKGFVQGARLAASGDFPEERILIFEGEQLVKRIHLFKPYPAEPLLMGIPISRWDRAALVAASALLAGTAAFGAWQWRAAMLDARAAEQARQDTALAEERIKLTLKERLAGLLSAGSVPLERAVDSASLVYRPGSRVELQADRSQMAVKVVAKLDEPENGAGAVRRLLSATVPTGCGRRPLETNKTLSEVYLTYECPSIDPFVADLLGSSR